MKQIRKWDEKTGMVLLLIAIFMLAISVFLCFSSDIWYDELFTMGFSLESAKKTIALTAGDVHPPLYYLIVNLSLRLVPHNWEAQVIAAKLVSVLPFFLCLLYAGTKVRKHFGMLTAGLFGFLLVSMPQMAAYTVEIRMYGYALFFVTAAMLHGYELAEDNGETAQEKTQKKNRRNWIALTLYALAACYTHYFACVAACMVYLYLLVMLLIRKKWKTGSRAFWLSGAVCTAGYLPWLLTVVINQVGKVKESYWIEPVSLRTLGGCVKFIFQPSFSNETLSALLAVIFFGLFIGLFGLLLRKEMKSGGKEKKRFLFVTGCCFVLAGIVLFGILASLVLRPVFVYRYMLPAMGVFWLGFAILVTSLQAKRLMLLVILFLTVIGIRDYRAFYGEEMWKRVQMEQTIAALDKIEKEDLLIFNFDQVQGVAGAYLPDNVSYLWYGEPETLIREMYPSNKALVEGEFSDEAGIKRIREFLEAGNTVWFLGSGKAREEICEKWKKEGILAEEKDSVLLERYWFNLYALRLQS